MVVGQQQVVHKGPLGQAVQAVLEAELEVDTAVEVGRVATARPRLLDMGVDPITVELHNPT